MYPSSPHEHRPPDPFMPVVPAPAEQTGPIFDPNAVVYPGDPSPEATLPPPANSGHEPYTANADPNPPNPSASAETPPEASVSEDQLAVQGIAAASPAKKPSTQVTVQSEEVQYVGHAAALSRLEAIMARKTEPGKPRDAEWWRAARSTEKLTKLERADLRNNSIFWPVFDSSIKTSFDHGNGVNRYEASFEYTFASVTPEGMTLQEDIEHVVAEVDEPIKKLAELGGTGSSLRKTFGSTFDASVAIALVDSRGAIP
jgi:hypothetical protein